MIKRGSKMRVIEWGSREKLYGFATVILRFGLGFVFLWFGIDKFRNTAVNSALFQNSFLASVFPDAGISVLVLGVIECLVGIALILGVATRIAAAVAAVMLLGILGSFGVENFVRDIGLLTAALSLFITGSRTFSIDAKKGRKKWSKH